MVVDDEARLAVGTFEERVLHPRHLVGDGADDGVADEVGEADLGQPGALAEAVDHLAVDLEQLGGHVAEAGGGRDRRGCAPCWRRSPRRRRGSACRVRVAAAGAPSRHGSRQWSSAAGAGSASATGAGAGGAEPWSAAISRMRGEAAAAAATCGRLRAIVGEELLPRVADRIRIVDELFVHLLDEPRVRAEPRPLTVCCCHEVQRTAAPRGESGSPFGGASQGGVVATTPVQAAAAVRTRA